MNGMKGAVYFSEGRYFRLSTNAQCRYQDAAGETLLEGMSALEACPGDMRRIRRMICAALSHEGISEEAAGDLMDEIGATEAAKLLGDAIKAAYPQAHDVVEETDVAEGNGEAAAGKRKTR